MDYEARYQEYQQAIEKYLNGLFTGKVAYGKLYEAMRYAILGGGKRVRPALTLEFARLGGIDWHLALPFACALELVHNYSLIHDDLPCMDDDDLRRGKPTCHKAYGETLAVLAGDALQPEAFRLIAQAPGLSAESRIAAAEVLAKAAGADGMVGGQVLDTLCHVADEAGLTQLNRLKTCAMISAAGCGSSDPPAVRRDAGGGRRAGTALRRAGRGAGRSQPAEGAGTRVRRGAEVRRYGGAQRRAGGARRAAAAAAGAGRHRL